MECAAAHSCLRNRQSRRDAAHPFALTAMIVRHRSAIFDSGIRTGVMPVANPL